MLPLDLGVRANLSQMPEWRTFAAAVQDAAFVPDELRLINAAGLTVDLSAQVTSPAIRTAGVDLLTARDFESARRAPGRRAHQ